MIADECNVCLSINVTISKGPFPGFPRFVRILNKIS